MNVTHTRKYRRALDITISSLFVTLAAASQANADLVTHVFSGPITAVTGSPQFFTDAQPGDRWQYLVTYDTSVAGESALNDLQIAGDSTKYDAIVAVGLRINNLTLDNSLSTSATNSVFVSDDAVIVNNPTQAFDNIQMGNIFRDGPINGTNRTGLPVLFLSDLSASVFESTALSSSLDVNDFDTVGLGTSFFRFSSVASPSLETGLIFGEIDQITLNGTLDGSASTGDYSGDGFVSQGDLDLVLLNWGDAAAPAGFDATATSGGTFDGQISQNELDGVLLNWGNGTSPTAFAIPEPTTAALLGLGGLALVRRARRIVS